MELRNWTGWNLRNAIDETPAERVDHADPYLRGNG
jgi:hypothetical protein